ncbi:MAG TPA: ABC transporter substrate-binding protein [Stellaceae bacterium]|nr:ABC transporter substrate-binding protein [Stellaceae bacterium]
MTIRKTMPYGATAAPDADERPARRRVLCAITTASAVLLTLGASCVAAQAADAIKIGVLLPLSGNFAANGQQALTGIKMYFDEVGHMAAGHKLDVIVEDTQGKPDVAVTKARKEVERDGAQVLTGIISSGVALAVNDFSRQNKIPLVLSGDAGVDEITMPGPLANPYLVRTSQNGRTVAAAAAEWAYNKKGWRKVVTLGSDYAGGVDTNVSFAQAFCKLGGRVIQAEWPPVNTADFGPYLTSIDRSADALVTFTPGADGLRLGQQYAQFGLKGKLPVLDIYAGIAYEPNLKQLGDAVLGVYSSLFYTPMLKTPENERFVAEFKKRTGMLPANEGPNGYVGAHAIVDAINAVHGDLSDKLKFMAALKAVKFNSPKGEISLDKYGQVIQTMYIREVQKVDGELANVPIASYPNVDQFWPFTPADFEQFKYSWKDEKGSLTDCAKLLAKK